MHIQKLFVLIAVILLLSACGGGGGGGSSPDHIAIIYPVSPAITCEAYEVRLELHDASHGLINVDADKTVNITTTPTVESAPATVLVANGNSSVNFFISQTTNIGAIDIDVESEGNTDSNASEDPPVTFLDAAFRFYANNNPVSTTPIGTQVAGLISSSNPNSQSLELRAVATDDSGACTAALNGNTAVQIAYKCINPTTCSGNNELSFASTVDTKTVERNHNSVADDSLSYTAVDMSFDSAGKAAFTVNYSDAGQIQLHAKKVIAASSPDPESTLLGSSNNFIVRPFGFDIDFGDNRRDDWSFGGLDGTTSSGADLTYAADHNGSAYLKTDENFVATISAVQWQAADDAGNDGIPDAGANLTDNNVTPNYGQENSASTVVISHSLKEPSSGGVSGTLSAGTVTAGGGTPSFANGIATSSMSWNEVGIIDISATNADYLGDSSADITGTVTNVGRFTPNHFVLTHVEGGYGNACAGSTAFTYIGQSFGYAASGIPTVTVIPKDSSGATLNNYIGDYKKLSNTSMQRVTALTSTDPGVDLTNLPVTASFQNPTLTDVSGSASSTLYTFSSLDVFSYTRSENAKVSPFDVSLALEISAVTDSDGIKGEDGSGNDITPAAPYSLTPSAVNTLQRFGRLRIENAFGPETAPLVVPINAEYFMDSANDFIINTDDVCTGVIAGDFDLSVDDDDFSPNDSSANPAAGTITGVAFDSSTTDGTIGNLPTFTSGTANFSFSAPGAGATAAIGIQLLDSTSSYPWLHYNWDGVDQLSDGNMLDDFPSSTATFGRFRGHDKIIYWQEVSN